MSESARKKHTPRKNEAPAAKDHQRRDKAPKEELSDSDDVERAVYDGMQDLRVKKPG